MKTIGEGTFGKVKLGTHILTGERVAVKVLEKERIVDTADVERVAREIHILKLIRHPHMIQLYEIIETPRQLYLIMEYACGGELFEYIVQHGRAQEREACRFLHQILAGIEKVHSMRVVHRDLKPENLLLDERQDIKIVDFGLSNTYREGQLLQTACGSPCYAAPEMIAGHKYVPSMVDIWSCGVILFALVCGYLPFEDQSHADLYKKILNAEYEMPNFVSKDVADLISGMLTTDPTQRMTLDAIRQHVWYRQIPEASIRDTLDTSVLDEEILEQLDTYGFQRDYAVKCLQTNKHNHVTTTYYLLKEKRRRAGTDAGMATNAAIADLEATGLDDADLTVNPAELRTMVNGNNPLSMAAVAAVATPARCGHLDSRTTEPVSTSGVASAPGSVSCKPGGMAVPKLNLGDMEHKAAGGSAPAIAEPPQQRQQHEPAGCHTPPSARSGHSSRTSHQPPSQPAKHPASNGRYPGPHDQPPPGWHHAHFGGEGPAPRASSVGGSGRAGGAPHSARGASGRYRGHSSGATRAPHMQVPRPSSSRHSRRRSATNDAPLTARGYGRSGRPASPWGGGGSHAGGVPYGRHELMDDGYDGYGLDAHLRWQERDGAPPLSARPRLQGNAGSKHRERPPGVPPAAWGQGPSGTRSSSQTGRAPISARGVGGSGAAGLPPDTSSDDARGAGGSSYVSCSSALPPRQIMAEALRALSALRVHHRQVSNFRVRCEAHRLRFEAEVLQQDRGGGFLLRFCRVAGDMAQYRELCAQLLAEVRV